MEWPYAPVSQIFSHHFTDSQSLRSPCMSRVHFHCPKSCHQPQSRLQTNSRVPASPLQRTASPFGLGSFSRFHPCTILSLWPADSRCPTSGSSVHASCMPISSRSTFPPNQHTPDRSSGFSCAPTVPILSSTSPWRCTRQSQGLFRHMH